MNVLILIEDTHPENFNKGVVHRPQHNKYTYKLSRIVTLFSDHTLFTDDPYLITEDVSLYKDQRLDIIVATHLHDYGKVRRFLREYPNLQSVPIIFEDGDLIRKAVESAQSDPRVRLLSLPSLSYCNHSLPKKPIVHVPYIHDERRELKVDEYLYDACYVGNLYYQTRIKQLKDSSILFSHLKLYVAGQGAELLPHNHNVKVNTYFRYGSEPLPAIVSIIDLKRKYLDAQFLTPKLFESICYGQIPLIPKLPIVEDIFGGISSLITYTSCEEWESKISTIKKSNPSEVHHELLTVIRSRYNKQRYLPFVLNALGLNHDKEKDQNKC
jgi:hypothetical protein